jgi:hypothetical protein
MIRANVARRLDPSDDQIFIDADADLAWAS